MMVTAKPTSKSAAHTFFLEIEPFPSERTKATCRGRFATVYTAPAYREWLSRAVEKLNEIAAGHDFTDVRENLVRIDVEVIRRAPKASKLAAPLGDNDNYEKGVWDAITKAGHWWADDRQIVRNVTVKRWAGSAEPEGYRVTITFGQEKFSK